METMQTPFLLPYTKFLARIILVDINFRALLQRGLHHIRAAMLPWAYGAGSKPAP
jgi:hypothetical protein